MLQDIIIVWFLTMGVFALTKEQMPFEFWSKISRDENLELRSILFEPLTECLCCMASFWTCVWFGWNYGMATENWCLILLLFSFILALSSLIGRAHDVDFLSKGIYFWLVFCFILFLPSNNIESFVCMVAVVGINYQLIKINGK